MDGFEYERKCAQLLKNKGFSNVTVTPGSGDQGIDIIAYKSGIKYGIQCKYYTGTVGNKAIQEAYAGAAYYGCAVAMVITNSILSKSATALASELSVDVWDNIDAIYLQKYSQRERINYEQLTEKEREDLQIKELEAYLEEKYHAFYAKYPIDENKDAKIAKYCDTVKQQAQTYHTSFEQELDGLFSRMGYQSFKGWRDPALTPLKNSMRECVRMFGRQLKSILDDINRNAEQYVSTGISVDSIANLADTVKYVFDMGEGITVEFNVASPYEKREIAKFTWPEKYFRIVQKWKTIKEETPPDPKEKDLIQERVQRMQIEHKIDLSKKKLEQVVASVEKAKIYIHSVPNDLAQKKAELKNEENKLIEKIEELLASYNNVETSINKKLSAARKEKVELESARQDEAYQLSRLFILSFKKKELSKQCIKNLDKRIEEKEAICQNLEKELSSRADDYQSSIQLLQTKKDETCKQIRTLEETEEKVLQSKKEIEDKEPEISKLQEEIDMLKKQLQNFHRKYMLEQYKNIIAK